MQPLFSEKPVTALEMSVDTGAVAAEVNVYLGKHTISEHHCKCVRVEFDRVMRLITVHLQMEDGTVPDEEFEHDEGWQLFCDSLSKRLNGLTPRLPYYYYHK